MFIHLLFGRDGTAAFILNTNRCLKQRCRKWIIFCTWSGVAIAMPAAILKPLTKYCKTFLPQALQMNGQAMHLYMVALHVYRRTEIGVNLTSAILSTGI